MCLEGSYNIILNCHSTEKMSATVKVSRIFLKTSTLAGWCGYTPLVLSTLEPELGRSLSSKAIEL